jgi:hypothetical protein
MATSASDNSENKKNGKGLTKFKEESVRLARILLINVLSFVR